MYPFLRGCLYPLLRGVRVTRAWSYRVECSLLQPSLLWCFLTCQPMQARLRNVSQTVASPAKQKSQLLLHLVIPPGFAGGQAHE